MHRGLFAVVVATLVSVVAASPAFGTFGGSNGKVAFARGGAIVSQAPGGGPDKKLAGGLVTAPSYSPNGKKIVYLKGSTLFGPGWFDIYTMNADGSGKRNLTKGVSKFDNPSFSPDGKRIMFDEYDGNPTGIRRIFTMRTDGTGRREFAPGVAGHMSDGVWSPKGTKVAYSGGPTGTVPRLRTISSTGKAGTVRTLAKGISNIVNPDWSPSGTQLVFTQVILSNNRRVILRVNADNSGLKKLADFGAEKGADEPVWSPNGKLIAFDKTSYTSATFKIWTMRKDGSGKSLVDGNGYDPAWQAR